MAMSLIHITGPGQACTCITRRKGRPGFRSNGIPTNHLLILETVGVMTFETTKIVTT